MHDSRIVPETVGSIPDLCGRLCEGLLVQHYWYDGVPQPGAGPVFLKPTGLPWQRIVIDHPVVFWRQVDHPDEHDTTPADQFHYPQIELGAERGVVGRRIERVTTEQESDTVRVRIDFTGGVTLLLSSGTLDCTRIEIDAQP